MALVVVPGLGGLGVGSAADADLGRIDHLIDDVVDQLVHDDVSGGLAVQLVLGRGAGVSRDAVNVGTGIFWLCLGGSQHVCRSKWGSGHCDAAGAAERRGGTYRLSSISRSSFDGLVWRGFCRHHPTNGQVVNSSKERRRQLRRRVTWEGDTMVVAKAGLEWSGGADAVGWRLKTGVE